MNISPPALAFFFLALGGCGKAEPNQHEPSKKELAHASPVANPKDALHTPASIDGGLQEHMQEHFEAIRSIERAIVIGDKDTAREQALALAARPPAANLSEYAQETRELKEAALALAKEESIAAMAPRAAELANRCGQCHLATTSITSFAWSEAPAEDGSASDRMQRHLWAMDRLWEGLVGPSEMSWQEGSTVLLAAPFPASVLALQDKSQAAEQLAALAALAQEAKVATEASERSRIYGELLKTCSGCHTKNQKD